ncbi:hypothetical protein Tco_0156350 [Tanacetum coccineum]
MPRLPSRPTWVDLKDGTIYIDIEFNAPPVRAPVQTPASPNWSSGSLPVSPASLTVPSLVVSPVTTPSATIAVDEDEIIKVDGKKKIITESTVRRDLQLEDAEGVDCLPNATIFEQLCIEWATPNESGSQGTTSGGGRRRQQTMGDTIAQTRFENVSKLSNDPLLTIGGSRGFELEEERGKNLPHPPHPHGLKDLIQDITLVTDQDDADMFDVNTLTGDEVLAESEVAIKDVNLSVDEVTLAQALVALKSAKVQEKGDVIEDPSVPVITVSASTNGPQVWYQIEKYYSKVPFEQHQDTDVDSCGPELCSEVELCIFLSCFGLFETMRIAKKANRIF